ncbi:hypothetical protein Tco_1384102 [Tanacetum coccineum]
MTCLLDIIKKLSAYNVKKRHFAKECRSRRNQGKRSYGDNGRSNAPTHESSSRALVAQYGLGGYDWSNNFEIEPVNYALMAISSSSSSSSSDNEISLSVFNVKSSDEESTPANDRSSKADGYHAVPPPIIGNFLWPRSAISFAVYESVNRDKVIIEDWNSDDEDDVSEVNTVSPVKTNETQTVKTRVDTNFGHNSQKLRIGFKKIKACFVCKSTNHLIKDCNFHDKKSQEPKLKIVVNNGPKVDKPVWDNTKRVNYQKFSKYPQLRKTFVPSGVLKRTGFDLILFKQNEKRSSSKVVTGNPEILLQDHAVVNSDELKFNLFSVSQMCDKKNSVLFTETECLIMSPSFKLLDESQVVLRAPRKDDVYSLDLKNIIPSGVTTELIGYHQFEIEVGFHESVFLFYLEVGKSGWMVEDLDNYHLKELRCSTQCHTQKKMWVVSRGVVLLMPLSLVYRVLRDLLGAQILYTVLPPFVQA